MKKPEKWSMLLKKQQINSRQKGFDRLPLGRIFQNRGMQTKGFLRITSVMLATQIDRSEKEHQKIAKLQEEERRKRLLQEKKAKAAAGERATGEGEFAPGTGGKRAAKERKTAPRTKKPNKPATTASKAEARAEKRKRAA